MPGFSGGPLRGGPNWRKSFRKSRAGRYATSAAPLPVFGADSAGNAGPWAAVNSAIGPLYGVRGYNTPAVGVPAAWPGPDVGTIPGTVPPAGTIISIRPDIGQVLSGSLDTALAAFFATVPAGACVTAWHESEIGGQKAGYSQAQVIAMHTRMYGLFNANAPAAASYGQIVASVSAFSGSYGYPLGPYDAAAGAFALNSP